MATSSAFSTTKTNLKYRIVVTENSYSIANNTSNVTVKVQAWRTNTGYTTYGHGTCYCTINGTQYSQSITQSQKFTYNSYTEIFSKTVTIAHNADGTKNLTCSSYIDHSRFSSSSNSFTTALTTIPRYATSNQSLASKTETSITMNWSSDSACDYIWYSSDNGSTWTGVNVTDGTSGSYTISGLSANTTYQVKTRVRRKDSQLTTDSSALSVTTYNYPYCSNMPNFTIGDTLKLGFYNPLGRSITVNILGADNSQISNDTTTGTSISGYAGSVVVNRLYASIPNAKSGTYKVKVTYGSQVTTKTGGTYSAKESKCAPTIGTIAYADTNSTTTAITQDTSQIIQNKSTVQFNLSTLTALNGASLSSVAVTINGVTRSASLSGTTQASASLSFGAINSASNLNASIVLTDSRGITNTYTKAITMLAWSAPTAIITLARQQNYYSETDIKVDGSVSSLDNKNTMTIQYQYKKVSDSSYSALATLQDNVTSTFTADNNYQWNVRVVVSDRLGSATYNLTLDKGIPIVFFDRLLKSMGIGCFPTLESNLEINGFRALVDTQPIAEDSNLNNFTETGIYFFTNNYTITNAPSGNVNGWLVVLDRGTNANVKQIWLRYGTINTTDYEIYVRTLLSAGWSNWRMIAIGDASYNNGDTLTFNGVPLNGLITSSAKIVNLFVPVGKSLANVSSIAVTACTGGIRTSEGGYVNSGSDSSNWLTTSGVTVTAAVINDYTIRLRIQSTNAFTNVTNNTPVSFWCNPLTFSFS